jgi:hypothetical protein
MQGLPRFRLARGALAEFVEETEGVVAGQQPWVGEQQVVGALEELGADRAEGIADHGEQAGPALPIGTVRVGGEYGFVPLDALGGGLATERPDDQGVDTAWGGA